MKANRKGICIRVVAALLVAVLFMSLCPVIPSASAAGEYTLTFGNNDLDLWPGSLKNPMVVNAGEKVQIPSATMTNDFYVLLSWKDESGKEYYPGDIITPDHDMKFTANTSFSLNYYQVTYRPGAEGGRGTNFRRAYKYNEVELVIPPCPEGFTPVEGYTFDGWEVESTTAGYSESFGADDVGKTIVTSGKNDYKMTAKWKVDIPPDYKITYHFNDPASEEDIKDGSFVKYSDGYLVTIKDIDDALYGSSLFDKGDRVKGCVFVGWSTSQGGTAESKYTAGNTVTLSDNLDLYAVWEPASFNYTVNYHFKDSVDGMDVETKQETGSARLDDPIPYDKSAKTDSDGKTYAFDSVAEEKIVTQVEGDNVIDVYYYIDTLSEEENSTEEADRIADKYQRVVTYEVENGTWADGTAGARTEVVTMMDGAEYSETGTAQLNAPKPGAPAEGYTTGIWNTTTGTAPETVTKDGPFEYTYRFIDENKAIIIQPTEVHVTYDGNKHTFTNFTASKVNGELWTGITVTLKDNADLEGCGWTNATGESGVTIDLNKQFSEKHVSWENFFDISGLTEEQKNDVIVGTGTIIIDPCPVEVTLNVDSPEKLTAGIGSGKEGDKPVEPTYSYDSETKTLVAEFVFDGYNHTLSLAPDQYTITGMDPGEDGKNFSLNEGKTITLDATWVGETENTTLDLTSADLELSGEGSGNYVVGKQTSASGAATISTGPATTSEIPIGEIEKITIKITPRPVSMWTYGGAKIFDGMPILKDERYLMGSMLSPDQEGYTDPEKKEKDKYIGVPKFEEIVKYGGDPIKKDERGFILRGTTAGNSSYTTLNHLPREAQYVATADAGIKDFELSITKVGDGRDETVWTRDYEIDYHNGYYTIYPQSITDNTDTKYHDVKTYISDDATNYDGYVAAYDANVEEYTYLNREKGDVPESTKLPAFYTGVKLVKEPAASYTAPYKFEGELLRNENNAEEYKDLERGTDYTVTYQRQNAAGEWEDTEDFSTPGTIQVTYKGIGNYRNRIVRTYELTEAPEPGPDPDPEPDPGPDVEINDHEHYAYMIGKPGGMIDPDGEITRAEIATIIFRLLKEDVREEYWSKTNSFPDVEITDWYNNAISTLENLGIVEGKGDGLYHPEDPITRAEMATMMARLYDYDVNTGDFHTKFDDIDPDAWYARYVAAAEDLGLFVGDGATDHFYPERSLSRAEAMTVYNRLLGRKPHNDGLLPEEQMILWPDNMDTAAWYYADVHEATNSHTCDMDGVVVDDKHYELWLEPLPVRDWAALERAWSEAYSGYDGHDVN